MSVGGELVDTAGQGRIVITSGSVPTDEELAAIVVALSPVTSARGRTDDRVPAWRRAAMLEAVGRAPATRPSDLDIAVARPG